MATATTLRTPALLMFALFVGLTTMINMPQMIGPANAQSSEAIEQACPPGTTSFSQGECTVTTTTSNQCPSGYTATGTGQGTCTGNVCPTGTMYIGPFGPFPNVAQCSTGTGPPRIVTCPSGYTLQIATGQCTGGIACPTGSTLQGQSCVTTTATSKPGQGNRP
jgi:hypothetical protein